MAEWSGFFDAHKVGESWDRTYLAEDFAKFFAPLIGNGVFAGESNELQVFQAVPAGMSVVLSSGQAWIKGYGYINDSDLLIPIDPADGALGRIDRVVAQWSAVDRKIHAVWKKGTPAVNPVAPTLRWDADYMELNLCTLDISAGLSAITQDKIHDTRMDSSVCGWVTSLIEQVDTSTLYIQWEAQAKLVLDAIQKELSDLEAGTGVEVRKLQFNNTLVPASSFVTDSTYLDYPYRAPVALNGVMESMIPEVVFSLTDAVSGNFASVAACYNGGVYIYAAGVPEADMAIPTILCWKGENGTTLGTTNAGGGGLRMELVWKNGSPSSAFEPDTISLDTVENEIFMIQAASGGNCVYVFGLPDGLSNQLQRLHGLSGSNMIAQVRAVSITHSGDKTLIAFAKGQRKQVNSTSEATEDNTVLVPRSIYRFKGASV